MKTSHELGRELLAGLDLPIYHFDPSRVGLDAERDTSLSNPTVEVNSPREGLTPGEVEDIIADGGTLQNFITISGEQDSDGEAVDPDREFAALLRQLGWDEGVDRPVDPHEGSGISEQTGRRHAATARDAYRFLPALD